MREQAKGQFTIEGLVEDIYGGTNEIMRLARISQQCRFDGTLDGESMAEYTAILPQTGSGSFQGFQRITGSLGERSGSFVVHVIGTFRNDKPCGTWEVVPKSGSGDFVNIRGSGSFSQKSEKLGNYTLEFDLRKPRTPRATPKNTNPG